MPVSQTADSTCGDHMTSQPDELTDLNEQREARGRRHFYMRMATMALWSLVVVFVCVNAVNNPTTASVITAAGLTLLFVIVQVQVLVVQWIGRRNFKRLDAKLKGSGYISELDGLPNRNYLLAELRREMPRARSEDTPFTLVVFDFGDIEGIRERRGADFADRAVHAMVEVLRRTTRNSDFLAHLGGTRFCVLLVECRIEDAYTYLRRLPGAVAVSDGRFMLDVPIVARMAQYDMESLYATDVLADAEESRPLQRKITPRADSRAA